MQAFSGLPRPVFAYNFGAVHCSIGPVTLSNFGADGSVSFEYSSQIVESEVSADGYVVYTSNNDDRVQVTITLSEASKAVDLLDAQMRKQVENMHQGKAIDELVFYMEDPATGDFIRSPYTVFLQEPGISKSKSLGTREFRLELPYARFAFQHAKGQSNATTT